MIVTHLAQCRLPHVGPSAVGTKKASPENTDYLCLLAAVLDCHAWSFFVHGQVEVLNRHVVDLPERVAGLPKELESRESLIPYDYDLSIEDPQYRVCTNQHNCSYSRYVRRIPLVCSTVRHLARATIIDVKHSTKYPTRWISPTLSNAPYTC